jgi:hypothetical protein
MLTQYHDEFRAGIPAQVPPAALPYFENPLLLVQMRPQLERMFGTIPGGSDLLQAMLVNVKMALTHGLQEIFFWSAAIMTAAIVLHVFLRRVPLRRHSSPEASNAAAAAAVH